MVSDQKKILNIKELVSSLSKLKNKKIVQCHGVFDLLHPGHIEYFKEAKKYGDILIVSLTSDRFVNKGPYKPVFNQNIRAFSLSNLEIIDFVFINDNADAVKIINIIKPNYYIKGPDYKNQFKDLNLIKEKNAVQKNGGKIFFTQGKLYSSTKILNQNFVEFSDEQKLIINKIKKEFKTSNLIKKLKELKKLKILVIGEAIIDEYIFCEAFGKSGKEPVMVNKKIYSEKYAGGTISIANSIGKFCDKVEFITYLGDKRSEINFIKSKLKNNIKLSYVSKKNSPTIVKTRIIDKYSKSKLSAIYDLNDNDLDENNENKLIGILNNKVHKYDLIVLADYGHGLFTKKVINFLQKKAKRLSLNLQLNALNQNFQKIEKYKKVDLICLHERELKSYIKSREENNDKLIPHLKKIIKFNKIIITRGNKGSSLYLKNNKIICPAFSNEIVDRIGAGDTLFGIASIFMLLKIDYLLLLFISNIVAGDSVKNIGTESGFDKDQLIKTVNYLLK